MRRRDFLRLIGAGATCPVMARAQPSKIPRIGILMLGNPDPAFFLTTFREQLRGLGYTEGQNISLELRSAKGSANQLDVLARELVDLRVDAIVAYQTPCVAAAKQATGEIPIVMSPAADPIRAGFIASFAQPGGNITGMTSATAETAGKNIDLIREVLPSARRVGVVANAIDPFHKSFVESTASAARALGLDAKTVLVRGSDELEKGFAEIVAAAVDAVIVQPSLERQVIADMALKNRLALFAPSSEFPHVGGLMSYSVDNGSVFRGAAIFVDKIIRGRKPADLPVELPTKFELVVNMKTAKALGVTVPPLLLARADEVIE